MCLVDRLAGWLVGRSVLKGVKIHFLAPIRAIVSYSGVVCGTLETLKYILLCCTNRLTFFMTTLAMLGWKYSMFDILQGVQENFRFFHSSLQPLPRIHIAVKDLQSYQRSASVQCRSYWLAFFCTTNSRGVLAMERWQTFENSREKTIFKGTGHFFENLSVGSVPGTDHS